MWTLRRIREYADQGYASSSSTLAVVPTVVVFNEGEEVKRFQANIMMTLEASQDDVQEAVDEVLMSDF